MIEAIHTWHIGIFGYLFLMLWQSQGGQIENSDWMTAGEIK